MVDIESDGPIPGDYSMIALGAVLVQAPLDVTFYRCIKPISSKFLPEALAVSGFSREQTIEFDEPQKVMSELAQWLKMVSGGRPIFISDNNGYDWMFVCWYFHHFLGANPFGYSSQNLGSIYKGLAKDMSKNFKYLRRTKHSHNPLDDAKGNAEAFLSLMESHSIRVNL